MDGYDVEFWTLALGYIYSNEGVLNIQFIAFPNAFR